MGPFIIDVINQGGGPGGCQKMILLCLYKDLSEIKLTKQKGHIFERKILFSRKFSDFKKFQEHKNYIIIAH